MNAPVQPWRRAGEVAFVLVVALTGCGRSAQPSGPELDGPVDLLAEYPGHCDVHDEPMLIATVPMRCGSAELTVAWFYGYDPAHLEAERAASFPNANPSARTDYVHDAAVVRSCASCRESEARWLAAASGRPRQVEAREDADRR